MRPVLAAAFALLLAAGPVRAQSRPVELPADEIIRLTEEAAHTVGDRKELLSVRPFAVQKDSTHSWDALHYRLDVKVTRTSQFIQGTVTTTLAIHDAGTTVIDFDAVGLSIAAVRVNGNTRTNWTLAGGKLNVPVCQLADCPPHDPGDQLTIAVDYSAAQAIGFYHYAKNDYSFVEPYDARYWWPCYDQPFDKATLDVYATVPDTNSCWSNGLLLGTAPATPGFTTWHWQETHPVATYLVAITVGKFFQFNQVAGTLPIVSCAFPEDSLKAKADFQNMPAMINVYSSLYGPYPFDKYGQIAVDPFSAGGMEHQTMTTLRRQLVRGDRFYEYVWAHELTHQWWGDWVTCVDFRDIWLNEGFATYGEFAWVENNYSVAKYDSAVAVAFSQSLNQDTNFRHAVYDPPPSNLFDATTYKKGGSVLHMLRRMLGDATFYAGLQLYGTRYAYGNATTRDFQHAMEDASGQQLGWFFDEWIFAPGIPTYQWSWQQIPAPDAPGQSDVTLFIKQTQTGGAPFYTMPIPIRVSRASRPDTTLTVWNDTQNQAFVLRVNGTPTTVAFDPKNNVLKRTAPVTVDAPEPEIALGHLRLMVTPNPARGPVQLRGAWQNAAGEDIPGGPAAARFRVYDAAGRLVRDLGEGGVTRMWDRTDRAGARVAPGLYFAEVVSGIRREARPIVIVQ
jgi:aminopeptidase N